MNTKAKTFFEGVPFILPLTIGLLIFRIFGFIDNIRLSFYQAGAFGEPKYIGLDNYRQLFKDDQFWLSLGNTFKFVIITIPIIMVLAIFFANILNKNLAGKSIFRTVYFLPAVILPVAVIQVFIWLFNTDFGLVNSTLSQLGMQRVGWFSQNGTVTFLVSLIVIYLNTAVPTVIILGGLQQIPDIYYEAAEIDGINKVGMFFKITLPLLTPSIFYVLLTNMITMLKFFDVPYIMFPPAQGPIGINFSKTIVYYYYQNAFVYTNTRGYAAAISVVLLVIIIVVTAVILMLERRFVNYDR